MDESTAELSPGIEVAYGLGSEWLAAFLRERRSFYNVMLVSP